MKSLLKDFLERENEFGFIEFTEEEYEEWILAVEEINTIPELFSEEVYDLMNEIQEKIAFV